MWVQMLIVLVANSLLLLVSRTKGLAPTLMGAFQGPNIKFTIYSLSDKMTQLINIRGGGNYNENKRVAVKFIINSFILC